MRRNKQSTARKATKAPKATPSPSGRGWDQMNRKQRREMARKIQAQDLSLEVVHPDAAGIDIGNEAHYVAVPPARDSQPVRRFGCTTVKLKEMAAWAEAMWHPHGRHAVHRGVLDSGVRHFGGSRVGSVPGERAGDEESAV